MLYTSKFMKTTVCRKIDSILESDELKSTSFFRFHLKLREVPCTLCDKMFIDEAASRKHLKTVHFKVKNFHCPHCDKSFSQRNKLTYHVRTHSGKILFCKVFSFFVFQLAKLELLEAIAKHDVHRMKLISCPYYHYHEHPEILLNYKSPDT